MSISRLTRIQNTVPHSTFNKAALPDTEIDEIICSVTTHLIDPEHFHGATNEYDRPDEISCINGK